MITLYDVLASCEELFKTAAKPWSNICKLPESQKKHRSFRHIQLKHDRYILLLTGNPITDPDSFVCSSSEVGILMVNASMPTAVAPLLAMQAIAVVVHDSMLGMEPQIILALQLASHRGIPVIESNLSSVHPLIQCHFSAELEHPSRLIPLIESMSPSHVFPFDVLATEDNDIAYRLNPVAPVEFLTDAAPDSFRFRGVLLRTEALFRVAWRARNIEIGKRYYAKYQGDLCVSITDTRGEEIISLLTLHKINSQLPLLQNERAS